MQKDKTKEVLKSIYNNLLNTPREAYLGVVNLIHDYLGEGVDYVIYIQEMECKLVYDLEDLRDLLALFIGHPKFTEKMLLNTYYDSIKDDQIKIDKLCNTPRPLTISDRAGDTELFNAYNRLVTIGEKELPNMELFYKSEFIDFTTRWRRVDTDDLPEDGVPVLVLLTNDCISIDWVNDRSGKMPFMHYHIKGWNYLSDVSIKEAYSLIKE